MTFFIMLFGLAVCVFEELMVYTVCKTFLKRRFSHRYQDFGTLVCLSLALFCINQLHSPIFNVTGAVTTSLIIAVLLFTGSVSEQIYCCSITCLVIFATEHVGFRILGGNLSMHGLLFTVIVTVLVKLTSFIILQAICYHAKSKNIRLTGSHSIGWCFFLYPISCFILLLGLRYSKIHIVPQSAGESLLIAGLFMILFSNMLLFFLYDYTVTISDHIREYELSQTRDSLTQSHFVAVQETNQKYSALLHDVNNYIRTVQTIQLQGATVSIQHISESLMGEINNISSQTFSSSPIINAILLEKKQEALKNQIDFRVFVEPGFPEPSIADNDLISLLCNLIDNAIEAAIPCENSYVDIQFFVNGAYQVIKIRNPYQHMLIRHHAHFLTSKTDTEKHGFGMKRIENIMEKYNGTLSCTPGEAEFTAIALIPFDISIHEIN